MTRQDVVRMLLSGWLLASLAIGATVAQPPAETPVSDDERNEAAQSEGAEQDAPAEIAKQPEPPVAVAGSLDALDNAEQDVAGNAAQDDQQADTAERNLQAQLSMADSARQLILPSWLQVIVGIGGIFGILLSLKAARDANKTARDALEHSRAHGRDQSRAYVHPSEVDIFIGKALPPRSVFHLKNSGQTPATWFEIYGMARCRDYPDDGLQFSRDLIPVEPLGRWNGIVGGDTKTNGCRPHGLEEAVLAMVGKEGKVFEILGFIRYATIFGEIYETEFHFYSPYLHKYIADEVEKREDEIEGMRGNTLTVTVTKERPQKLTQPNTDFQVFRKVGDVGS